MRAHAMESYDILPDLFLSGHAEAGRAFLSQGLETLHAACKWVQKLPYGFNASTEESLAVFTDGRGTCMSKHGAIARLAAEMGLPIYKYVGFYRLDESILDGVNDILFPHGLSSIPQTHCILGFHSSFVDLTRGNCHGKKRDIVDMDLYVRTPYAMDRAVKTALYLYGLQYYKGLDPALNELRDDECLELLLKCDTLHKSTCSLAGAVPAASAAGT